MQPSREQTSSSPRSPDRTFMRRKPSHPPAPSSSKELPPAPPSTSQPPSTVQVSPTAISPPKLSHGTQQQDASLAARTLTPPIPQARVCPSPPHPSHPLPPSREQTSSSP